MSKKSYIAAVLISAGFAACNRGPVFNVEGEISGAEGKMLYIEHSSIEGVVGLDSAKLGGDGRYHFSEARPEAPDFYRLRIDDRIINFVVDSTETVNISSDYNTFSSGYSVTGSESNVKIKELSLLQAELQSKVNNLYASGMPAGLAQDSLQRMVEGYKDNVKRNFIYKEPDKASSYFALFQQIDGLLFFDLYDKEDSKAYGAVATSYDHFYPESPRSKHLYNLALQSIKVIRAQQQREQAPAVSTVAKNEVGYVDIQLPNLRGETVSLSSVAKGKTVLVNFTAYMSEWSPALNMDFRELYDKYRDKGFEIYQISLDSDLHFWKNAASNLPWVCVRDPQSVYSQIAGLYNVKQLPAIFILDKKGNLVKRIGDLKELDGSIRAAL